MLTAMTGTMRTALAVAAASLLLTSCSGEDSKPAADEPTTSQAPTDASSSATPEAAPMTMVKVCPEVEAALPSAYIPGFEKMSAYVDRLNELSEAGDVETQNALELLTPQATALMLVVARNAKGSDLLDPLSAHLDGLTAFAKRCKSAGSSALQ